MFKLALIGLVCAAGVSTAALADNDISVSGADGLTRTATVNIADLNLTTANGKVALRKRLKQAVVEVCATDAECNYTTERATARMAWNAIGAANGQIAMAVPTSLTVAAAR